MVKVCVGGWDVCVCVWFGMGDYYYLSCFVLPLIIFYLSLTFSGKHKSSYYNYAITGKHYRVGESTVVDNCQNKN